MANLLQIHHEDGQGDDTFGRFGESGVDFAQTALQLARLNFRSTSTRSQMSL